MCGVDAAAANITVVWEIRLERDGRFADGRGNPSWNKQQWKWHLWQLWRLIKNIFASLLHDVIRRAVFDGTVITTNCLLLGRRVEAAMLVESLDGVELVPV